MHRQSRPPLHPEKTLAGIVVDPRTLDRVVPESRRPDGRHVTDTPCLRQSDNDDPSSVRQEIKIRKGYTPVEDVGRFRSGRQAQIEANALPKGHIVGWVPPAVNDPPGDASVSKAAKKNLKRRQRKRDERAKDQDQVPENWDDPESNDSTKDDGANPLGKSNYTTKRTLLQDAKESATDQPKSASIDDGRVVNGTDSGPANVPLIDNSDGASKATTKVSPADVPKRSRVSKSTLFDNSSVADGTNATLADAPSTNNSGDGKPTTTRRVSANDLAGHFEKLEVQTP